ncbi:hypothetical protein DFH09DRAFT_1085578 [Mycena vulgaris]|nr:hypothetical protein DFH09DRAFT_1085578 [Mycena vulgaris]
MFKISALFVLTLAAAALAGVDELVDSDNTGWVIGTPCVDDGNTCWTIAAARTRRRRQQHLLDDQECARAAHPRGLNRAGMNTHGAAEIGVPSALLPNEDRGIQHTSRGRWISRDASWMTIRRTVRFVVQLRKSVARIWRRLIPKEMRKIQDVDERVQNRMHEVRPNDIT